MRAYDGGTGGGGGGRGACVQMCVFVFYPRHSNYAVFFYQFGHEKRQKDSQTNGHTEGKIPFHKTVDEGARASKDIFCQSPNSRASFYYYYYNREHQIPRTSSLHTERAMSTEYGRLPEAC